MTPRTLLRPARHAGLALELALAGPAVWKHALDSLPVERETPFRQQMDALLDLLSLAGLEVDEPESRRLLRDELRSARREGSLEEAECREVADGGYPRLARLFGLRTPWGDPLLPGMVEYIRWRSSGASPESGYDPDSWRCLEITAGLLDEYEAEVEELLDAPAEEGETSSNRGDADAVQRLFQLGLSRHLNGEYRQAAVHFTAALKLAPADACLYAHRGDAYRMECEYERALADFHAALRLAPSNPSVLISRAAAYHLSGEYERAVADCEAVLGLRPDSAAAYRTRAAAYAEMGSVDQALADLGRVIALAPEDDWARYQRGLIYAGRHEYDLAVADFDRVLDRNPHHVPAWLHRGDAHRGRGDHASAILDYGEVLRHHPDNVPAYTGRALAYRLKGDRDRAIADYTEALRRDPENARVYYARGVLYRSKGEPDLARADFDEALRRTPENWGARYHRGKIALAGGQFEEALADLTESLSLNPGLVVAYLSRALAFERSGQLREGIEDADRAVQLDPESAAARLVRGMLFGQVAEHTEAVGDLTEAIRLDGRLTPAYQERCLAYTLQGEYDLALADCSRVIELEPGNARAYAHRSVLRHLKGEVGQSLDDYSQALRIDPRCVLAGWNPGLAEESRLRTTRLLADYVDGIRHPAPRPAVAARKVPVPQQLVSPVAAAPTLPEIVEAPEEPRADDEIAAPAADTEAAEFDTLAIVEEDEPDPAFEEDDQSETEELSLAIENLITDPREAPAVMEITEAPADEGVAAEPAEVRATAVSPPPPRRHASRAEKPERPARPARKAADDGDSFSERWKKPGLTAAVGLAALVVIYFCLPASLFGSDRPRVHPARGQLFFEDKPLPDANIVLAPAWTEEPNFPRPHATVAADGSFVLRTYGKDDGAPAGEYRVVVTWFEKAAPVEGEGSPLQRNLLPPRYGKFSTSGLTLHVAEGENQHLALKLSR